MHSKKKRIFDDKFYSVDEIAERLRVSRITIVRRIECGDLQCLRIGDRILVSEKSLEAYLSQCIRPKTYICAQAN